MRRTLLFTLLAILLVLTSSIRAQVNSTEVLTNDTIISLTQANLGDSLIISKIKTSRCKFDLSTDNLLNLKNAGVSNAVLETMIKVSTPTANVVVVKTANDINDPQSPHDAGIYVYDGKTMIQLEPTTYSGEKTAGFFTSALTYGMAPIQTKASIKNPHASVRVPANAEFYFYFEQSSSGLSNVTGIAAYFSGATSPNEFALLRMESKRTERDVTLHTLSGHSVSPLELQARIPQILQPQK